MVAGKKYDGTKIDIWATGIILYAMLCGFLPFEDKDNDILFDKILECKINYPDFLSSESKDLISKILVVDPEKRIDISGIKNHSFFIKGKNFFEQIFSIKQISKEDNNQENNYVNNDKQIANEKNENGKIKEIKETNDTNDTKKEKTNDLISQKQVIEVKNNNSIIENKENINTENLIINESIIIDDIKFEKNIAENNVYKNEKNIIFDNLKNRKNVLKCINFRKVNNQKIEEFNHKIKLQKDKNSKNINVKKFQNNYKIEKNDKINSDYSKSSNIDLSEFYQ
jgi:5'-AMP-activated protein kinase catalytic alpha subunit